jgi:hypothetical protein
MLGYGIPAGCALVSFIKYDYYSNIYNSEREHASLGYLLFITEKRKLIL